VFFRKRRFHTLQDIRKLLLFIPPIFVFFLSVISIFVTSIILEDTQQNKIDLLLQEEQFYKKELLKNYIDDSRNSANALFDKVEKELNHSIYEVRGYIKSMKYKNENFSFDTIKPFLQKIEEEKNVQFVFFNSKNYDVIHGKEIIGYLQTLTNSNIQTQSFRVHMLKNIHTLGNENLQYWIDKERQNIRLSYFEEIPEFKWYFGAFSKVDDINGLLKHNITKSLGKKSKGLNYYFWFYDYGNELVYNYNNRDDVETYKDLINTYNPEKSKQILEDYHNIENDNNVLHEDVYNFPKYQYLVGIKNANVKMPNDMKEKISKIKDESLNKFTTAVITIIFMAIFLSIATTAFSKYINIIFSHYNRRLEIKNKLLVQWKERYELAIIASNDGLWDINFIEDKIFFSEKWLEMFGYEKDEITTFEQWLSLIHHEDRQKVKLAFEKHLEGKSEHFVHEYRLKTKSNDFKWVLVRGKAFRDENDSAQRMLMMSMDIEERKQLTKELRDVELLVEYGRIVIFKWKNNDSLDVEHVSKGINTFGYSQDDFQNKKIKYLDFVHEKDVSKLTVLIQKAIKENQSSFTSTHRIHNKEGDVKWVFFRTIFLKDHFGKITHLYGYITDITTIKMNEVELKLKIKEEVAKNTEKDRLLVHQSKLASMGEMLGNIAHQWRQPLNNINLLIHFVRDNYNNKLFTKEDLDESIKSAKIQIDYMSQTIDDFRNFYKPTKNKELFDIKKSIEKAAKITATQFEVNNIKLNIENKSAKIDSYENEFQQVIVNILNNAKDAAIVKKSQEDFDARVNINIEEFDNNVKLEISNNCGTASKEVIDRMFEPYFTTKFETQGTGIGLYMVKIIIETNMGGHISAQNSDDGLKFVIILPL